MKEIQAKRKDTCGPDDVQRLILWASAVKWENTTRT
jgi:hypothetical protein